MVINISKTIISVRKKQCNISSHMNYLQFAFKGLKYARNSFFVDILAVSEILEKLSSRFSHTEYL